MSKGTRLGYEGDEHLDKHPEMFLRLYQTIPGPDGQWEIWFVDGEAIRDKVYVDFTQASNPVAFGNYVPWRKIILDIANEKEADKNLIHEVREMNGMMRKGLKYDPAHDRANEMETEGREHPEKLSSILQEELRIFATPLPSRLAMGLKKFSKSA